MKFFTHPLAILAEFINNCTLAYLILLAFGIIKLRKSEGLPQVGQFKTPLVPFLPLLSIIICLSFVSQYQLETWLAFGTATVIGLLIYGLFGYKQSLLNKKS